MCVDTYSLIYTHFLFWTLIYLFIWFEKSMVSLFDISEWYHHIWCILYTNKVNKGNTLCIPPRWVGVACFPILSVSFEQKQMGCEPVLFLAAFPDEAVSIICCTFVDKTIPSTLGEVDVCELYYWPARCFSRASCRCFSFNLSWGILTWLTYTYGMFC